VKDDEFQPAGEPTGAPPQGQARPVHRILVADDESAVRLLMTVVLNGSGYHVDAAEDGAVAWAALQANPYDLLITDHYMPKITGVELVKKLRSARIALPVVMVTGTLPTYELAQNPSLQLAATLEKPFAATALLDTVENVLRATESPRKQIDPPPDWRSQPSGGGLQL
jgi:DNA-binding NtrC family response regulator